MEHAKHTSLQKLKHTSHGQQMETARYLNQGMVALTHHCAHVQSFTVEWRILAHNYQCAAL